MTDKPLPSPALLKALDAIQSLPLKGFWERRMLHAGAKQDVLFRKLADELEYATDVAVKLVGILTAVDANHAGVPYLLQKRDEWEKLIKESRECATAIEERAKEGA